MDGENGIFYDDREGESDDARMERVEDVVYRALTGRGYIKSKDEMISITPLDRTVLMIDVKDAFGIDISDEDIAVLVENSRVVSPGRFPVGVENIVDYFASRPDVE